MLLWCIFFQSVLLILNMYSIQKNTFTCVEFLVFCLLGPTIYRTVSLGQLVLSPQVRVSRGVFNSSKGMLDCLGDLYHLIDTETLQRCVIESTVYNISIGRMPYARTIPVAFVTNMFKKSVFVVDKYYSLQNDINQALILIHECSHLTLATKDHAYRWQTEFKYLTDAQHMENADSYIDIIVEHCLTDTDVFF